jgi:glycosyltransferase involved in cell wall biosynthesis
VPRRVLFLITDLEIGGTPTVVRELAVRLHRPDQGVHVEVACLSKRGPVADQIEAAGVEVTALGATRATQLLPTSRRLAHLVRDRRFDTVFSFLLHANAVAALASRKLPGVRFLQSIQTVQPRPRWHWWVQKRVRRAADKFVVPSSAVARVARERSGIPDDRIVVIPNAVDPGEYPRVPVFRRTPLRIGFLGRLDPVKNLDLFVYAVSRIDPRHNVQGHIFGDGPMRQRLERLVRDPRYAGRVQLRGAVSRPQDALGEMDLLFFPSGGEGFGLVLIEAMASGVPVVAIPRGGVVDVVRHDVNGVLLDWKSDPAGELAQGLGELLDDQPRRDRLIAGGLAAVRERFNWDAVIPQYRAVLGILG